MKTQTKNQVGKACARLLFTAAALFTLFLLTTSPARAGGIAAWGSAKLGNNTTSNSNVPVAVTTAGTPLAGKVIASVAAGAYHSVALASDGTLAAWGDNGTGQLGDGTANPQSKPTAVRTAGTVLSGKRVIAIAAGGHHSLALCSDGTLVAWGQNGFGQLGNGTTTNAFAPVAVQRTSTALDGRTIIAIAAGAYHSMALCSDGVVAVWGRGDFGQIGNGATNNITTPSVVKTFGTPLAGKTVKAIAVGGYHNTALCSDGTLVAWGRNQLGQLGDGSKGNRTVPVAVKTSGTPLAGRTVTGLAAGNGHSLALCSDQTLAAWGDNGAGELGTGNLASSTVPVAVKTAATPLAGKIISAIVAGCDHSLALATDGTLAAWGGNSVGQLGRGNTANSLVPVAVSRTILGAGERFLQIAAPSIVPRSLSSFYSDLDPTFGTGGRVTTAVGSGDASPIGVAIASDGKIVVAVNGAALLLRYNTNGALDAGFGSGGRVFDANFGTTPVGVAVQSTGKIVVAGNVSNNEFVVARYNVNGTRDTSFGSGGKATSAFATLSNGFERPPGAYATCMALQSDDKIVVGGTVDLGNDPFSNQDFAVARFTANGALDPSFSFGGMYVRDFERFYDVVISVVVQGNGNIVAVGRVQLRPNPDNYIAIVPLGNLNFEGNGYGAVIVGETFFQTIPTAAAFEADGKIIVAGLTQTDPLSSGFDDPFLLRLNANGSIDTSFADNGEFHGIYADSIVSQPDIKFLTAAGGAVVRYNRLGIVDKSFQNNLANPVSLALQKDGKLIVVGTVLEGDQQKVGVIRYINP